MKKEILVQYIDLQKELVEVRERIGKLEVQIDKIEQEGAVVDKVMGGDGGFQPFRIEGFPYPEYSRKKTLLYNRKAIAEGLEMEIETIQKIKSKKPSSVNVTLDMSINEPTTKESFNFDMEIDMKYTETNKIVLGEIKENVSFNEVEETLINQYFLKYNICCKTTSRTIHVHNIQHQQRKSRRKKRKSLQSAGKLSVHEEKYVCPETVAGRSVRGICLCRI